MVGAAAGILGWLRDIWKLAVDGGAAQEVVVAACGTIRYLIVHTCTALFQAPCASRGPENDTLPWHSVRFSKMLHTTRFCHLPSIFHMPAFGAVN